ncbi:MAG: pilus assembly protein N-terminal domain-containing protein [Parvularculaceae bacterium]
MRTLIAALLSAATFSTQAAAEEVWLTIDQVRPYEIDRPAGQIVIGNPGIADLTVQDKTRVLLYGKTPGLTNMYIFDDEGAMIDNLMVRVRSTTGDMLTMHRGAMRTTYNCSNQCEATVTVGDDKASFGEVSAQAQQKASQLSSGGGTTGGQ